MTATLRLRLGVNGERPKEKPSLDRKVEVSAVSSVAFLRSRLRRTPDGVETLRRRSSKRMALTRRTLLSLLVVAAPAIAGRAEVKRAAKEARRRVKQTKALATRDVADRKASAKRRDRDRHEINANNAELDQARRRDLVDLTRRRQARITRPVVDPQVVEEPKPGVKPAMRGVESAPEPKEK